MTSTYVLISVISYLLGSIPFGYVLVRLFLKQDIRTVGSGNIGATNVARSGAKKLGILTLVLDALKGFVAVIVAQRLCHLHSVENTVRSADTITHTIWFPNLGYCIALAAVFAILGHVFPVWLRFKGGKGVATGMGVFLAIAPVAVLACVIVFGVIFVLTRWVSLASIVSAAAFTPIAYALNRNTSRAVIEAMLFVSVLIILKHHGNIGRLIKGTEPKFGARRLEAAVQVERGA
jgi:acyl phosphate:glycerol-3-phosphate acyltransferase